MVGSLSDSSYYKARICPHTTKYISSAPPQPKLTRHRIYPHTTYPLKPCHPVLLGNGNPPSKTGFRERPSSTLRKVLCEKNAQNNVHGCAYRKHTITTLPAPKTKQIPIYCTIHDVYGVHPHPRQNRFLSTVRYTMFIVCINTYRY